MARARIKIDGSVGSNLTAVLSTPVTFTNDGDGSETSWLWEMVDEPPGAPTSMAGSDTPVCTFTPLKRGTYLVRLTINAGKPGALTNSVVLAVRHTNLRVPAALERKEAGATGWAPAVQEALLLLNQMGELFGTEPSADVQAFLAASSKALMRTALSLGSAALSSATDFDTAGSAAARADARILGLQNCLTDKGTWSCGGDPAFPAATRGDFYAVVMAGKIGGSAGRSVGVNDVFFATATNAGGTEAAVGDKWDIAPAGFDWNLAGYNVPNAFDAYGAAAAALSAAESYTDTKVLGLFDIKATMDCHLDPDFPSALKGDLYIASVAGKIGGAAGRTVEVGDIFFAFADNAGGTEAAVGASWDILQYNLSLATPLLAASNLSDLTDTTTARTNLGLGSAAQSDVGEFEPSGAAATAVGTAEAYTDTKVATLQITKVTGQTTTAVPYVLFYFPITDNTLNRLEITIVGKRQGSAKGVCFTRILDVLRSGGADPSIEVITTPYPDAATGGAAYTISVWDVYSGQIYVQVVGDVSATVDWSATIQQMQAKVP